MREIAYIISMCFPSDTLASQVLSNLVALSCGFPVFFSHLVVVVLTKGISLIPATLLQPEVKVPLQVLVYNLKIHVLLKYCELVWAYKKI